MTRSLCLALVLVLFGCQPSTQVTLNPNPPLTPGVLASFEHGQVTQDDLEQALLAMPVPQRPAMGQLNEALRTKLIKKIALDTILLNRAEAQQVSADPTFQTAERQLKRLFFAGQYLQAQALVKPVTEDDLQAYFQEVAGNYASPEKRHVLHIFRRIEDHDKGATLALLNQVRQRMLNGENWADLAREYSHSESRHKGGTLGLVVRGQFSADFDQVVFALPKGVPSEPVATAEGYHLFFVQSSIEAFSPKLAEIKPQVTRDYQKHLAVQQRARISAELPTQESGQKADRPTLHQYLALGDPELTLFQLGPYRLSVGELRQLLREQRQQVPQDQLVNLAGELFDELCDLERIYQHLEQTDRIDLDHPLFQKLRRQKLVDYLLQQQMRRQLENDEPTLREYHQANPMRFASPLRVQILRLRVPFSDQPTNQMAALEAMRAQVHSGSMTAQDIAERLGGTLQNLPLSSVTQLERIDPRAPFFSASLEPGEVSPPYRQGPWLIMLQMVRREQPQPQSFETVKAGVVTDYLTQNLQDIFERFSTKTLTAHNFQMHPPSSGSP